MSSFISQHTVIAGGPVTTATPTLAARSKSDKGEVGDIKVGGDAAAITISAIPKPHVEIFEWIQDNFIKGSGIKLDIKEINNYQAPNPSLEDGSPTTNFYRIPSFLAQQNKEKGYDFASTADVHIGPMSIYTPKDCKNVGEIREDGTIVLSNDPANTIRSLKFLAQAGLIELGRSAELLSGTDATSNPKKLKFITVDGAQVYKLMPDAEAAIISGNCTVDTGLNPKKDALILGKGGKNSEYPNQFVARKDDKDNEHLKKLAKFLNDEKPCDYINKVWPDGAVVAVL